MSLLADNASRVREKVAEAAERSNRDPASITIVAVSKTFDRAIIDEAYSLGFRVFGENRTQEIQEKFSTPLPDDAILHMIGSLQTNKVRHVLPHIHVLETVDRESLIARLDRELTSNNGSLDVMLQVNVSGESQKSGIAPEEVNELLRSVLTTKTLNPIGLMTMAPLDADDSVLHSIFGGLRELRDRLQEQYGTPLPSLSMGMSNDFQIAIAEGANHVRIGRALFGSR